MKLFTYIISIIIICIFITTSAYGQGLLGGGGGGREDRINGKAKFLPIPYIGYNRSIGYSVGALPMLMFNPVAKDTLSPSSIAGAFGMYSENKTWFVLGFVKLFFNEDKWRLTIAGGGGEINYQFYLNDPIDNWIPYSTTAGFAFIQVERKIVKGIYGGVNYMYTKYITSADVADRIDTTALHGLGLSLAIDKRSSYYYPRNGYLCNIDYTSNPSALGNKFVSNRIEIDYNHYFPFRKNKDVFGVRFYTGIGIGDVPFNNQFIVRDQDIRGYSEGAFRGNHILAIQGEYRWNFHKRFGAVGFAGVATIFEAINADDSGKLLPGIGTGFRFVAIQDTHFTVGMDVAAGIDDWSLTFRIGEAF